jgi:hypothetical protein
LKRQLKTIGRDKFQKVSSYNSVVQHCRGEYNKQDAKNNDYAHYWNSATIDKQFLYHILNIFGLKYDAYIKNTKLVEALNQTIILEFFADTVHRSKFDMTRFSQAEYFDHINRLLNNIGIQNFDSKEIRDTTVSYNALVRMLENNLYCGGKNPEQYIGLINTKDDSIKNLPKINTIRDTIRTELDKNPVLKYIVCTNSNNGNLRDLRKY